MDDASGRDPESANVPSAADGGAVDAVAHKDRKDKKSKKHHKHKHKHDRSKDKSKEKRDSPVTAADNASPASEAPQDGTAQPVADAPSSGTRPASAGPQLEDGEIEGEVAPSTSPARVAEDQAGPSAEADEGAEEVEGDGRRRKPEGGKSDHSRSDKSPRRHSSRRRSTSRSTTGRAGGHEVDGRDRSRGRDQSRSRLSHSARHGSAAPDAGKDRRGEDERRDVRRGDSRSARDAGRPALLAERDRDRDRPGRRDADVRGADRPRDHDRRRDRERDRSSSRQRGRSRERSRDDRKRGRSRGRMSKDDDEEDEEYLAKVAAALADQQTDEDRLIEERRRRRAEILAKHAALQQVTESAAAPTATGLAAAAAPAHEHANGTVDAAAAQAVASLPPAATPPAGAADKPPAPESNGTQAPAASRAPVPAGAEDQDFVAMSRSPSMSDDEEAGPATLAADSMMDVHKQGINVNGATPEAQTEAVAVEEDDGEGAKRLAVRAKREELDMFDDAAPDDLFAATPDDKKADKGRARRGLVDAYDDIEGYYNFQVGEVVDGRYEVFACVGKGVFSTVLRARDLLSPRDLAGNHAEVAIKVIRSNDTMYAAGKTEVAILRKLAASDADQRYHCVRMLTSFEYRQHLCIVMEPLALNLRELTKKYGRNQGLNMKAVHAYAKHMLQSLYHLKNCGVLHADIKPDNILVNAQHNDVKLCDFGSAMFSGDNEITPYLVSRFYRAPEIILGLPYDYPLDMWSVGCVIFELLTAKILFPGKTNNEMLKLMMDVKGSFPKRMLKKGAFADRHFENDLNMSFALLEEDKVTKRPVRRVIANPTVKHNFAAMLAGEGDDPKKVAQLADLLERMVALDPEKRISPKEALKHPFIKTAFDVAV